MSHRYRLFTISFAEGASVMAAEIAGAKLLAPFFGSSLYVWSSVMAITLGGLASGYFLGGKLSRNVHKEQNLFYVLMAAVCCLCVMPFMNTVFYVSASHFSLIPAVVLSVCALLFPAMLCMGATSPMIISLLTHTPDASGENSGKIYAISTLGGIAATFLCGFYLIPTIGVSLTLISFAVLLAIASLLILTKKKIKPFLAIALPALCFSLYSFARSSYNPHVIYQTEGVLGKLEIREEPSMKDKSVLIRKLLINTIVQSEMDTESKASVSEYVGLLEKNSACFSKGKALVLGLGGGLVSNMLVSKGYQVTGVEFDERIIDMAKRFFYLDPSVKTICDDARHYINSCDQKYQLVLFDIFKAEEQPAHVITRQSLSTLKAMLDTNAIVLINTHGYLTGPKGLGTHCLLSTLKQSGFSFKLCAQEKDEAYRNLLIVASLKPLPFYLHHELPSLTVAGYGVVNEDDKPVMELLNAEANQEWRTNYIRNYILTSYE